jgi:hypothetical protein
MFGSLRSFIGSRKWINHVCYGRQNQAAVCQHAVQDPRSSHGSRKNFEKRLAKTLNDPEFQAQARERKLDIEPVAGDELESLTREVIAQPADVVERMKKLLEK